MAVIISQIFSLGKSVSNYTKEKTKYNDLMDKYDPNMTQTEEKKWNKKVDNQKNRFENSRARMEGVGAKAVLEIAQFAYNYSASTTRFGLRGKDIEDQLQLQDRLVNKAFGLASSIVSGAVIGGIPGAIGAGLYSLGNMIVSEVIGVSIQNKAYEYKRELDAQQKAVLQERIGREIYNSSRR